MNGYFKDKRYTLYLQLEAIYHHKVEKEICEIILSNIERARTKGIRLKSPIPFVFRLRSDIECDESDPLTGICIETWSEHDPIFEEDKDVLDYIKIELSRHINNANQKFIGYSEYKKIVIFEFYGECYIDDDDIIEVILSIDHLDIDEIWIAIPKFITEYDYVKSYLKVI